MDNQLGTHCWPHVDHVIEKMSNCVDKTPIAAYVAYVAYVAGKG